MINIIACQKPLFKKLGYPSRNKFDDATGSITELRNAIMHPVRPLVTDANSVIKLKEVLETVLHLTQLLEERSDQGFLLKKWGINLKERWNIHT